MEKTVKDVINDEVKLTNLEESLPANAHIFVECLRGIASVHKVLVSDTLHPDYEAIITNFVTNWKVLEDKFEISCTLKMVRRHMPMRHMPMRHIPMATFTHRRHLPIAFIRSQFSLDKYP